MSDKKETQNSAVDWAERLRASMNAEPAETSAPTPAHGEDDDLAALLRAQLARNEQAVTPSAPELDTSEFEEETEESPSPFEEEFDTEPEDIPDPDDLPWEDDEDEEYEEDEEDEEDEEEIPDLPPEPETVIVYRAEEDVIEDIPDPDDLPWEDDEEYEEYEEYEEDEEDEEDEEEIPDLPPEPETVIVYRAEEEEEPETPTPLARPTGWHYTIEPVPYDEDERMSPDGVVGDIRLMLAEEESARLLEALNTPEEIPTEPFAREDEPSPEAAESEEPMPAAAEAPTSTVRKAEPVRRITAHDPLQLGLDDILPPVETLSRGDARRGETAPEDVSHTKEDPARGDSDYTYTRRMARHPRDRERTVQDSELYLHLGYEKQLMRTEQQEAVEEARRRARERNATSARNETRPVGRKRREFTDPKQTPAIERAYARSRRLGLTRLMVAAVGAIFCILHDLLGIIPLTAGTEAYSHTVFYPAVGVLLTVLVCLPFLSRLGRGLASLFDFEPTRYAVSALALIAATAHGILTVFTHGTYLYGGVALFMLAVATATEYASTLSEEAAFAVVSAGKESFVLTDETTPAASVHSEKAPHELTLTAVRTGRVSDFFARTGRYNPYMGRLNYLLPVSLLAAILCAGLAVLRDGDLLTHGLTAFTATYLICLPAAYVVSMSLPLLAANRLLIRKGAAVLGTAAPTDLCRKGSTRLLIRDGAAVGGFFRKEITLRDDTLADLWRKKAACLFRLLECPLWKESPLGDDISAGLCVEVAETEEGYVHLFLIDLHSGETNDVMMGSREALTRRGVRLPKASMEQVYKKTDRSHVVYLAFDGTFRIAYAVEYRLGAAFADTVRALASLGDRASLVTYDPLVGEGLLQTERLGDAPPAGILRPTYVEPVRRSCSACVIATGRSLDLLHPYAACHRMKRVYHLSHTISWAVIPAAMVLALVTILGGCPVLLSSAAVTAWQILLAGISLAVSLCTVTRASLFLPPQKLTKHTPAKPHANPDASAKAEPKTDKDQKTS